MQLGRIWAEIDLDALEHNLRLVRESLSGQKVLLAIKADAYGHGAAEIGAALQNKVDVFGVAGVEEGINLRQNGVKSTPILVLSPLPYHEVPALFDFDLTPTVTEPCFIELLGKEAARRKRRVKCHVEVDTGMGRTGVTPDETAGLVESIGQQPFLEVEGIFYALSDCRLRLLVHRATDSGFRPARQEPREFVDRPHSATRRQHFGLPELPGVAPRHGSARSDCLRNSA